MSMGLRCGGKKWDCQRRMKLVSFRMLSPKKKKWMLYGANGYTGELIARRAIAAGHTPILAGRNKEKVESLASELGLQSRVFSLENSAEIQKEIKDVSLVLHCAGPFIYTSRPMAEACIATKTHYLDITGEIPVYESLFDLDSAARKSNVMLLPGVGFDIVPTDCLAANLKSKLKDAVYLRLAFLTKGSVSSGTARSAIEQMPKGSKVRREGFILKIEHFSLKMPVIFEVEPVMVYAIPWGDVFTAYLSTAIPNIEVYTNVGSGGPLLEKIAPAFKWIDSVGATSLLAKGLSRFINGPDKHTRETAKVLLWGRVENARGKTVEMRLQTSEAYEFTVESALLAVDNVLRGKFKKGFMTPSLVFGKDFVTKVPGTKWISSS